jgi:hypothetical protein
MNAFISWSGSRELSIARAIKEWLTEVVPTVRPFMSPELPKGQAWFDALAAELKGAQIALMCLAPPRVAGEWQLVEAGAIWKAAARGGLFPLCFGIRETDVPEPLRAFQLTYFDKEDFERLAVAVAKLARQAEGWTAGHAQAFERCWPALKARVEDALSRPDDGVHTTRGFIHEIRGGWWERVRSVTGGTELSWVWIEPSADGTGQTMTGRGFGKGGSFSSRWQTSLVSVQAQLPQPILEYYWEGRNPGESQLFGGKGRVEFTIASNGNINDGAGEFKEVCLDEARIPTTKLADLQRATLEEIAIMKGNDEKEKRALADRKLQDWP